MEINCSRGLGIHMKAEKATKRTRGSKKFWQPLICHCDKAMSSVLRTQLSEFGGPSLGPNSYPLSVRQLSFVLVDLTFCKTDKVEVSVPKTFCKPA